MAQDPYDVLGVPHGASEAEIKIAYRRLAKKSHPDLHPGDASAAQKMNEINAAYDRIKNPQNYQAQQNPYSGSRTSQDAYNSAQGGTGDPFEGFDPFAEFFGGAQNSGQNRTYYYYRGPEPEQEQRGPTPRPFGCIRILVIFFLLETLFSMCAPRIRFITYPQYVQQYAQQEVADQSGSGANPYYDFFGGTTRNG